VTLLGAENFIQKGAVKSGHGKPLRLNSCRYFDYKRCCTITHENYLRQESRSFTLGRYALGDRHRVGDSFVPYVTDMVKYTLYLLPSFRVLLKGISVPHPWVQAAITSALTGLLRPLGREIPRVICL
jgi:hypothetical protein